LGFVSGYSRDLRPGTNGIATVNVANLSGQRDSVLSLYRTLIRLRKKNEALVSGRIEGVAANGPILRYERRNNEQHFVIFLNLGGAQQEATPVHGHVVASTYLDREDELIDGQLSLRPSEGLIVNVE
jgi:alpha-glucosidase